MEFGVFDVIVFYKFVDEVTIEFAEDICKRIAENDNVYVCPNNHPELGLFSTNITLYSSMLSVEEIGAALFDDMDGNVVDKLKIRYGFEGENSEGYIKNLFELMPKDNKNFIHYGDSSLYIWTKLDVEGATDLVLNAIEKMDEPDYLV